MVSIQRLEHLPETLMTAVLLIPHILVVLGLALTVEAASGYGGVGAIEY